MKYDVTVIGAGPAGLAAAINCAQAGLRVAILERSNFPRNCVGESVHPGIEAFFRQLGISADVANAGFLRYPGIITVARTGRRQFSAFGQSSSRPWLGFHLWRPQFDEILLRRARACGVFYLESCNPKHAEVVGDRVVIQSACGPLESRVVIDGTGRRRWLSEQWSLRVKAYSPPLIARYGYQQGTCREYPDTPTFIWRDHGWDWMTRLRSDLYQWISLPFREGSTKSLPPPEFRCLPEYGPSRGADVTWRIVRESAGEYHFLVGDACATLDPSSSHGVLRALASGILAARCIREMLERGFRGYEQVTESYRRWQWQWFHNDVSKLRTIIARDGPIGVFPAVDNPLRLRQLFIDHPSRVA